MSAAQKKEVKTARKILANELKRGEVARPLYRVIVKEDATTVQDVLRPEYWAHVAPTFSKDTWAFAIVELIWQDGSKYLEVMVMEAGNNYAKVKTVNFIDFEKQSITFEGNTPIRGEAVEEGQPEDEENDDYEVKHRGGAKWSVLRKADKQVMVEGLASKADANTWLTEHLKAMDA